MNPSTLMRRSIRRAAGPLVFLGASAIGVQNAPATTYVATFSGITDTSFYFDPYNDPPYTYSPLGPFSTSLSFTFPFEPVTFPDDPDYIPPQPFDGYGTDPVLGPIHSFIFPDPMGGYVNSRFDLGYRSFSYFFSNGEGSYFDIGVISPTAIFSTIAQPTPIDIDVTGSYVSQSGYYKEPQYGYSSGQVTHLTISAFPSVPEPASWALMLVGFCAVGFSMRYVRGTTRRAIPGLWATATAH